MDQLELTFPSPTDRTDSAKALDDLFYNAQVYRSAKSFQELMVFAKRFGFYSPYNAMLAHIQMPGAKFVASPSKWREYGHSIKAGARPIVILQTMGPVIFVFDVSDTVADVDAPPLPREVTHPFEIQGRQVEWATYETTVRNATRDGIDILDHKVGSQRAGSMQTVDEGRYFYFEIKSDPPRQEAVPVRFALLLNADHSRTTKFTTITHELAHLYCGHLGTPNPHWWPDRRSAGDKNVREFEAEAVSYLVCSRYGLSTASDQYLSGYLEADRDIPAISLETVLKAAGLIEQMGRRWLGMRKPKQNQTT